MGKPRPITHETMVQNGHLALNLMGITEHRLSENCWCKPFLGFRGYFEDIQGKPDMPVWVHRNYNSDGSFMKQFEEGK